MDEVTTARAFWYDNADANATTYIINFHPAFIIKHSSRQTDLALCFNSPERPNGHKLSLTPKEQQRFLFLLQKLSSLNSDDFGIDLIEPLVCVEFLIFLNGLFEAKHNSSNKPKSLERNYEKTNKIITYINQNLSGELNLNSLSKEFSISTSHLNRIFKEETGITPQKYIAARRIAFAKTLLADGHSVTEVFSLSGFGDYSNFYKTFTKMVGISPKNYAINTTK